MGFWADEFSNLIDQAFSFSKCHIFKMSYFHALSAFITLVFVFIRLIYAE